MERPTAVTQYDRLSGASMSARTSCVVLFASMTFIAPSYDQRSAVPAAWQTSWEAFVATVNKCVENPRTAANPFCHTKEFTGKEVVWEGVIASVDPIRLDMGTARLKATVNGILTPADRIVFELTPESTQLDKWKSVAAGQRVRFRTRLGSQRFPDDATSFSGFSRTRTTLVAFVESSGAELLSILPAK